ncbi:coilin isoform X1 [Dendrobium catenatum]|uniref:Uncharacterized protein n=2 Tax=Dendrobium catenatum TaxID=906689 RepID=A0A2I0V837_9ASPA|nr:coilin isoform X1 [Dendrobium catenatum]PKU59573.1 hypothetical protein MA16_Dca023435 [Dendrobium catenatum]
MSEPVRLRVVFEDAGLLRGSQRRRGLQRCWLQLRPGIDTIADLAAHLHVTFGLQNSCPHGLIISMDGFVLPLFESTCILKDEDIIMIKKNGVMFHDFVKFCGSQNEEKVIQRRPISAFNNRILAIMDTQVDSQGDENDKHLFNRSTVHVETPPSEQMNEHCERKHFNKLQGSNNTLAITDSQGNSQGDEENVGLHGNIENKETTSYKMVNAKRKKKHANKLQYPDTLANKDSQADSQGYKADLGFLFPHKETSSSEMIKQTRKRKHFNILGSSDDTLAIKDSQRNSMREEDDVLHGNTAHKEATSNEMMNTKPKRKHSNKLPAYDTLAIKDFHGGSQGDEQNVGLNGNIASLGTTSNEKMNAKHKKNHTNKSRSSENESKGNDDGLASKNDQSGDAVKVPSRSARRKKAKRIWHRTLKKEKKVIVSEFSEGDNQKKEPKYANDDQNTDADEEIVHVVVPGHIHFESSDACRVRSDEPQKTLQWNGTTSKKKGQKWGREDTFNKWDDDTSNCLSNVKSCDAKEEKLVEVSNEKSAIEEVEAYKESIVNQVEPVNGCSGNSVAKEFEEVKQPFEFESFKPLLRFPEEGDVLVYRVVELSSSWCPQLSTFRVGRVSSYDCSSSKVILLPLPEYPLISEERLDEGQESSSLYKEDGTLEIDFPSLVDVRLFKAAESIETTPSTTPIESQNAAAVHIQESASCSSNRIEISSDYTVNDQLSEGWEVINRALNEKKAQLQKQNDLDKRKSSLKTTSTGPWSYSALRRNALGPTLSMLRNSNDDTGK